MLTVRDLMAPDPINVAPEDTLRAAVDVLTSAGVSGAPVVSGGRAIGVVTLSDILAFEADSPGARVVRPEAEDLEPGEEADLAETDGIIEPASSWFFGMWDAEGPDVVVRMEQSEGSGRNDLDEYTVAEVMSRELVHVAPTLPLAEAARVMASRKIHRVLVLEAGAAVGILTTFDVVRAVARGDLVPAGAARAGAPRPAAPTPLAAAPTQKPSAVALDR